MAETSSTKERLTPITGDQLQTFKESVLVRPDEDCPYTLSKLIEQSYYDIMRRQPYGGAGNDWPNHVANFVYNSEMVAFFSQIYETTDQDEQKLILAHEIIGWNALYGMAFEAVPSKSHLFNYEESRAREFIHPNYDATQQNPSKRFWHLTPREIESFPKLRSRIEGGMPREMQLILLASTLPGANNQEVNWLTSDGLRTSALCEELSISSEELRCVYEVVTTMFPEKCPHIILGLFSNESLLAHYFDDALDEDLESSFLANPELVTRATRQAFANLITKNNQDALKAWFNLVSFFGYQRIEEAIPTGERTNIVHDAVLTNLANPHLIPMEFIDELAVYIDETRLSKEAFKLLGELLRSPSKKRAWQRDPSDYATEIEEKTGIKLKSEVLRYGEYPYKKLTGATIRYGNVDSGVAFIAQLMLEESSGYDPILREMLNQYTKLSNDDCLRVLGQGYSYDDDPKWFDERAKKATSYKKQIVYMERRIIERASNVIDQTDNGAVERT